MTTDPPTDRSPGGADPRGASADGVLDPVALQRLAELDPTGGSKLLERIARAFEASVARLLPQLRAAGAQGDAGGVRHVAHTLKSSSASIGAIKLAGMCADMEEAARKGRSEGLQDRISALSDEIAVVLEALKRLLETRK